MVRAELMEEDMNLIIIDSFCNSCICSKFETRNQKFVLDGFSLCTKLTFTNECRSACAVLKEVSGAGGKQQRS